MPEEMELLILVRVSEFRQKRENQILYIKVGFDDSTKGGNFDLQVVVTVIACILIEVISNIKASIVVRSILEINEIELI